MGMGCMDMAISVGPRFTPVVTRGADVIHQRIDVDNEVAKLVETPVGRVRGLPFYSKAVVDAMGNNVGTLETFGDKATLRRW